MECVLRAYGEAFDVDAFLAASPWRPHPVFHAGEPRLPHKRGSAAHRYSGFHLAVPGSDSPGEDFAEQAIAVLSFLTQERDEFERLRAVRGLEFSVLDFGVPFREERAMLSVVFPLPLVQTASALSLVLQATIYRTGGAGEWLVPEPGRPT